jgi:catechol 2,3-dioxygenase-like lactoylglutathione lyase family enzyme
VSAPRISGVLETCLYVDDLARAQAFYDRVLALPVLFADDRLVAYDAGAASVLLLFARGSTLNTVHLPGGAIPPHDGQGPLHFALAIPADALDAWRTHLANEGVEIESEVVWPRGGVSIYFRDPDGHLAELGTPGLWKNYQAEART